MWEFPKLGVPYCGVPKDPTIRVPVFSETFMYILELRGVLESLGSLGATALRSGIFCFKPGGLRVHLNLPTPTWVVVKIRVPFWVPYYSTAPII